MTDRQTTGDQTTVCWIQHGGEIAWAKAIAEHLRDDGIAVRFVSFLREMAIGLIIIAFLMFEPDGLAHRWRQIKTYWKLYPFSH